jgi:hypothetical protein
MAKAAGAGFHVKHYVATHHTTVTNIINRHLENLRRQHSSIDPEVEHISGLVPAKVDAVKAYQDALTAKQR